MNDLMGNGTNSSTTNSSIPGLDDTNLTLHLQIAINCVQILGLPINGYVLWLILSGAGGTIASEFFYLNLTASVMVFCLTAVFTIASLFTSNCILKSVCYLVLSVFFFLFLFSVPSFQCCICVERYLAVVHPVVFLRYKALRYRVGCCCVVWLVVLIVSLLGFWSQTVLFYILLGFYLVCISVVSLCCLSVLRALKQPGPGEGQRDSGNDMKSRAFKLILISLIVMILTIMSFIPFCLAVLVPLYSTLTIATFITYAIGIMSVFVHPLLYVHKAGKLPCFKGF